MYRQNPGLKALSVECEGVDLSVSISCSKISILRSLCLPPSTPTVLHQWVERPDRDWPELRYVRYEPNTTRPARPRELEPYNRYEWVPDDPACPLVEWSPATLCHLFGRTNVSSVLFVGGRWGRSSPLPALLLA